MTTPRLVDLSQDIYVGMPVYSVTAPTQVFPMVTYEAVRAETSGKHAAIMFGLFLSDHAGTHVDSTSHSSEDPAARTIDQFPVERFYTSAICLDLSHVRLPGYFTAAALEAALGAAGLRLQTGDTVLLYTGHFDRTYPGPDYMTQHCGLDREAAEWLGRQGVVNIGVDAPSIEHRDQMASGEYPAHKVCVEFDMNNTENLRNLDQVAGRRFGFVGLPLKIRGASGSPIRAIAVLPD